MNRQYDQYDGTPPHEAKSATSTLAAEAISPSAGVLRARVLAFIQECGTRGATCDEVEVALDMSHQTASARTRELKLKGLVRATTLRPTRSGRLADVLVSVVDDPYVKIEGISQEDLLAFIEDLPEGGMRTWLLAKALDEGRGLPGFMVPLSVYRRIFPQEVTVPDYRFHGNEAVFNAWRKLAEGVADLDLRERMMGVAAITQNPGEASEAEIAEFYREARQVQDRYMMYLEEMRVQWADAAARTLVYIQQSRTRP